MEVRRLAAFQAGEAEAVVPGPLLGMAEHLEGLGRLLELDDRLLVARIAVGVVLQRQLAVGLGDLVLARGALDAQDFVVIAFFRHRRHIVAYVDANVTASRRSSADGLGPARPDVQRKRGHPVREAAPLECSLGTGDSQSR